MIVALLLHLPLLPPYQTHPPQLHEATVRGIGQRQRRLRLRIAELQIPFPRAELLRPGTCAGDDLEVVDALEEHGEAGVVLRRLEPDYAESEVVEFAIFGELGDQVVDGIDAVGGGKGGVAGGNLFGRHGLGGVVDDVM